MYFPAIIFQPHLSMAVLYGIEAILTLSLLIYALKSNSYNTNKDSYILEKVLAAFRVQ